MDRVPGSQESLPGLAPAMNSASFTSLGMLVSGWLFSGRGIVARMIVAAAPRFHRGFHATVAMW
jgi:hypothetical protein